MTRTRTRTWVFSQGHTGTKLTEVPSTGWNVFQNLQQVPGTGNTPGTILYVPYRT